MGSHGEGEGGGPGPGDEEGQAPRDEARERRGQGDEGCEGAKGHEEREPRGQGDEGGEGAEGHEVSWGMCTPGEVRSGPLLAVPAPMCGCLRTVVERGRARG